MSLKEVDVSPMSDSDFHNLRQEICNIPPRKLAKWRTTIQDVNGVVHRVHFVNGNFVFKDKSKWIMVVPMSEVQMRNDFGDVDFDEPKAAEFYRRATKAFDHGGSKAVTQEVEQMMNEERTGNHRSKTHKVKVHTAAGEPVRG